VGHKDNYSVRKIWHYSLFELPDFLGIIFQPKSQTGQWKKPDSEVICEQNARRPGQSSELSENHTTFHFSLSACF